MYPPAYTPSVPFLLAMTMWTLSAVRVLHNELRRLFSVSADTAIRSTPILARTRLDSGAKRSWPCSRPILNQTL